MIDIIQPIQPHICLYFIYLFHISPPWWCSAQDIIGASGALRSEALEVCCALQFFGLQNFEAANMIFCFLPKVYQ